MSGQTILLLILVGIAAGILSGMVGVGGGIIIVPALVLLLGFTQKSAQGTSLGMLMLPVGILGVLQYYKQGHVDIKVILILGLGFILGSLFGSKIALGMSDDKVKKVFAVVLIFIALKMIFFDKPKVEKANTNVTAIE
jgi:uncharacterized membrane protein YfcA